jgi:hypothetical protein
LSNKDKSRSFHDLPRRSLFPACHASPRGAALSIDKIGLNKLQINYRATRTEFPTWLFDIIEAMTGLRVDGLETSV